MIIRDTASILLAAGLAALALAGCVPNPQVSEQVMKVLDRFTEPKVPNDQRLALRGVAARSEGDDHMAEILFEAALSENPGNALALLELGNLYRESGRNEAAAAMFSRIVALAQVPENAVDPALVDRARALMAITEQAVAAPAPDPVLLPYNPDRAIVMRFQALRRLRDEGLINAKDYEKRRAANRGALLPLTAPPADASVTRPAVAAGDVATRLRAIERFWREGGFSAQAHAAERAAVLDALLPRVVGEPAPMPFSPKDTMEARLYRDRLARLVKAELITSAEARREEAAIAIALAPVAGNAPSVAPPPPKARSTAANPLVSDDAIGVHVGSLPHPPARLAPVDGTARRPGGSRGRVASAHHPHRRVHHGRPGALRTPPRSPRRRGRRRCPVQETPRPRSLLRPNDSLNRGQMG